MQLNKCKTRNEVFSVDSLEDLTELELTRLLEMSEWAEKMTETHEAAQLEREIEESGAEPERDILLKEAETYLVMEQGDLGVDALLQFDPAQAPAECAVSSSSSPAIPIPVNATALVQEVLPESSVSVAMILAPMQCRDRSESGSGGGTGTPLSSGSEC